MPYWLLVCLSNPNGRNYQVFLIVTDGVCSSKDSITHFVNYYSGLLVPNSFAPNTSSGESSVFLPKGKSLTDYHLQIFDKFGTLLWESNLIDDTGKPLESWDGTSNGIALPQGTYIWKIQANFSNEEIWEGMNGKKSGTIYLIR